MTLNVGKELADLKRLTVRTLTERYAEAFGETTVTRNKAWLIKRIIWRMQAREEGPLSERAKARAAELADEADLRISPPQPKKLAAARQHTVAVAEWKSNGRSVLRSKSSDVQRT